MDIRDFVKIKRIPGGSVDDSAIVKGEVFSNRVIRVGMPLSIDNANILLVKDSISYAREDRFESTLTRLLVSVTRLGDLLDFGQLFKAFGNN